MSYEKIDSKTFKSIDQVATVYNLPELKSHKVELQNDIVRIQEEIQRIDGLILEADKLGIKEG